MRSRISRRIAIGALAGGATALAHGHDLEHEAVRPFGWTKEKVRGKEVLSRGRGPTVVLLHELNGLSPGTADFGVELAASGFTVHMPVLFGHALQDNSVFGYVEACWTGGFSCSKAGSDSKAALWVRDFVAGLGASGDGRRGIGVIGMCLTGAFPLITMKEPVRAVVMSQPALPFGSSHRDDPGVSQAALREAKASGIPILGFRFRGDTISTCERFRFFQSYFGTQFEGHEFERPDGFKPTLTHRLHAVLTGPFGQAREYARGLTISFLNERLSQAKTNGTL